MAPGIPPLPADLTSPAYIRFKTAVDASMAGAPYWEYRSWHPALLFRLTGQTVYATEAVRLADARVAEEEARIAAGTYPAVAGNQYLDAGAIVKDVACTYSWCLPRLTAAQRSRWAAYCRQVIANIWNPPGATWGGRPYPWPGWSMTPENPGNNYYHGSFVFATVYWALASGDAFALERARHGLDAIATYYTRLPEGGSLEGTGYGESLHYAFELYRTWKDAMSEDYSIRSTHCRRSIDYWLHATVPTLDRFAPLGDQARDSSAMLYDYHRKLLLEAIRLYPLSTEAKRGRWFLQRCSVPQMVSPFNYVHDLLTDTGPEETPTETYYPAAGVGHYFWRSGWTVDASWFCLVAGPQEESHQAQEQGAFYLYRSGWKAGTANLWGYSGIYQSTAGRNVVRFERLDGSLWTQRSPSRAAAAVTANAGGVVAMMDLSAVYGFPYTRQLDFDGNSLNVVDAYTPPAGVVGVWQVNTPDPGLLRLEVVEGPPPVLFDWRASTEDTFSGGWRWDVRNGTRVRLTSSTLQIWGR